LRSSIAVGEGLSMLLAAGVIALAGKKSPAEAFKAIGKGVWNADHNALVSAAILTGLSSAMGGEMQKVAKPDDLAIVAMQGVAITVGLLPLVLGVSGIAKRNIELFDGIAEGWRDSAGENPLRRLYEATMGGADAFRTPYVFNRVLRAPTLDIPAASLRSLLGWDSNAGYGVFVGFNFFATNPTATMTFPETGGTGWERDALVGMLRRGETEKIKDHWIKAAQRIPLSHVLRPHRLSDALFAFWSIKRIASPPLFPQMPETHYFSSLHQLITGGSIDAPELEALLSAVASLADDALAVGGSMEEQARRLMEQDVLRPILQVLAAARGHETHGGRISRFLDENGWVLDALAVDVEVIPVVKGKYLRQQRSKVRSKIAMPIERYDEHVREYAAQAKASEQEGPFTKRSFGGVEEFCSSVATEPNGTVELPPEELPPEELPPEIYAGGTGEGGVTTGNPADITTGVPPPLPAQPVKAR